MQNAAFYMAKDGLPHAKRPPFVKPPRFKRATNHVEARFIASAIATRNDIHAKRGE